MGAIVMGMPLGPWGVRGHYLVGAHSLSLSPYYWSTIQGNAVGWTPTICSQAQNAVVEENWLPSSF